MNVRIPDNQGKSVISRAATNGSVIILLLGVSSNCVHFTIFFFAKRRVGNSLFKDNKVKKTHKAVTHQLPTNCGNLTSSALKSNSVLFSSGTFKRVFFVAARTFRSTACGELRRWRTVTPAAA